MLFVWKIKLEQYARAAGNRRQTECCFISFRILSVSGCGYFEIGNQGFLGIHGPEFRNWN